MKIVDKILHSYAIYCRKEMGKIFKCYLIPKKSYDTLFKGAIFFWPTLYNGGNKQTETRLAMVL